MSRNKRYFGNGELDAQMQKAAELLASGEYTYEQIGNEIGVHRNTIYNWSKDEKFKAAVAACAEEQSRQTAQMIKANSKMAMDIIVGLAKSSDKRVAMEASKYILDHAIGKPTTKIEVDDKRDTLEDDYDIDEAIARIKASNNHSPLSAVTLSDVETSA